MRRNLLHPFERGAHRPRPRRGKVRKRLVRTPEWVPEVLGLHRHRDAIERRELVRRALQHAFRARAVIAADVDDQGVVELAKVFDGLDDPADLVVGIGKVSSIYVGLLDEVCFDYVSTHMLGTRLTHGVIMTGGFFLGPRDFYERLRTMPPQELAKIDMTRIDFINQLYGNDALKRAQRRKARFMNTTMVVTLLGAAASDALESGQVVSGVGGQYNFVAMSHALADARLIMMLRATHDNKDGLKSSIVWNYGHVTIPRHLRDVVITEYGVAELRGQSDGEVVKRLIAVADSRFQDELVKQAKAHGKLTADYEVPECYRHNLPEALAAKLKPWAQAGLLPDFPFGTDLTEDELHMVRAMKRMKHASHHPTELLTMAVKSLWDSKEAPPAYLERLGLAEVHSFKDRVMRRLFANNL